jgi:chromosome segregation ATPase
MSELDYVKSLAILKTKLDAHLDWHIHESKYLQTNFEIIMKRLDELKENNEETNNKIEELRKDIHKMDVELSKKTCEYPDCMAAEEISSNAREIETLKNQLLEYRFFRKYPSFIYYAIMVMVFLVLFFYFSKV